jgi:dihydroorotate dehydrogenase (fumarate)
MMPALQVKYLGLQLRNPLIVGSSGLSGESTSIARLAKSGAGAIVLKSIFEEEILNEFNDQQEDDAFATNGYEARRYLQQHKTRMNLKEYTALIKQAKGASDVPIIASINCLTPNEWPHFAGAIERAGADALELNLFTLPSDLHATAADIENRYFYTIRQVLREVKMPVSIKISYYFSNLGAMLLRLSETGVAGLVLFNRYYSPDFDIDRLSLSNGATLSESGDYRRSMRWIAIMRDKIRIDLAASTGIHDAPALIKLLLAGANVVQVVSAIYRYGPEHISAILRQLTRWMEKHNFADVESFRGLLQQSQNQSPEDYERVQFIRDFRGFTGD